MNLAETSIAQLKPVSTSGRTTDQIYDTLKDAILKMELRPGALVSEAEISQSVGASRTPVRAALARLRDEGLIATLPSRGNYVTYLSATSIREAHFIRDAIETSAIIHLSKVGFEAADKRRIEEILNETDAALAANDRNAFHGLDDDFHHALADATGHLRLSRVLARERALLNRLRVLSLTEPSYMRALHDEHREIFDAINARDTAVAQDKISYHLSRVLTTLDEMKQQHVEFFEKEPE